MSNYIDKKQAATQAGVSLKTIDRWIAEGLIEAYKFGPRLVRINPESLTTMGRAIHPNWAGDAR